MSEEQRLMAFDTYKKYVWYVIRSTSYPVDIARIKDVFHNTGEVLVNHNQLIYEPAPTNNINNINELTESSMGQHWLIDIHGV